MRFVRSTLRTTSGMWQWRAKAGAGEGDCRPPGRAAAPLQWRDKPTAGARIGLVARSNDETLTTASPGGKNAGVSRLYVERLTRLENRKSYP